MHCLSQWTARSYYLLFILSAPMSFAENVPQAVTTDSQIEAIEVQPLKVVTEATPSTLECLDSADVWELSTRHLPDRFSCINTNDPGISVFRHSPAGWQRDTIDSALEVGKSLPILYVHGNFMERNNARQRALIINSYLKRRANRPYRLYMLSWPSQREHHPLKDVYENAASAECQALYMAWMLERLGGQPQVSVLGFSFGARSVTGGLHLASGGSIPGLHHTSVTPAEGNESVYRVGLVAPAVDRGWLSPRGKHREALNQVEALVNLYNSRDPILRRFRLLDRVTRPVAAGFAGFIGIEAFSDPRASGPLESNSRFLQYDCGGPVGKTHDEKSYYRECPQFRVVLDHLLWNETLGSCNTQ